MDKKTIIGLILLFAIFVGYQFWIQDDVKEKQRVNDSIQMEKKQARERSELDAQLAAQEQATLDSLRAAGDTTTALATQKRTLTMGVFNVASVGTNDTIRLANNLLEISVGTLGAQVQHAVLKDFRTFDSLPLDLITPATNNFSLHFTTADMSGVQTDSLYFKPYVDGRPFGAQQLPEVGEGDSATLQMRAYIDSASYLEFAYTLRYDSYEVDFDIHFVGLEQQMKDDDMKILWQNRLRRQEMVNERSRGTRNRNADREITYSNIYYKPIKDEVEDLGRKSEGRMGTRLDWVAFKQQYFATILTSKGEAFKSADFSMNTNQNGDSRHLATMYSYIQVPYDAERGEINTSFYFGPTKYRDLRAMGHDYEKIIKPLGWWVFSRFISRWIIIPTFNFLEQFNWNYGLIIIIFTLLFRLLLLPLMYKSYQGSAIMRILKPEMDALNAKYPKPEDAMKKQQQMMALQKSAGYSPMAGCLPMLIQMPILTAMFMFFPIAIELRQKSFLWCDDLSTYDSILNLGFNIPIYGDHVSLFCLLMFGMQFFYTWYTMRGQNMNAGMPGMKFMMYFMPFMMLFIFNSQSAGLNLYYFISLCFTMTTMILIRRFTSEKKVRARMAAYAQKSSNGKPKKKSSFQRKLEEMQKMAEQMQKQQNKK